MSITDSDVSTKEKLHHVQESTNDDGTLNVEITDWREHNGMIEIEYQLPTAEYKTQDLAFPDRATDDYDLVRLCESCGYSIGSLDQLIGERVKYEDGSLVIPENLTWRERVSAYGSNLSDIGSNTKKKIFIATFWPVVPFLFIDGDSAYADGVYFGATATWLWILLLGAVYFVFF